MCKTTEQSVCIAPLPGIELDRIVRSIRKRDEKMRASCSFKSSGLRFRPNDLYNIPLTIVVEHGRAKILRDKRRWRISRQRSVRTTVPTSVPISVPTMAWLKALPVGKYNVTFFRSIVMD